MAVHILFRPSPAQTQQPAQTIPANVSPVRRSARLVPHHPTPSSSTPASSAAAMAGPSSSRAPVSKSPRQAPTSRKRPRAPEPQTSQTESESESDDGRPVRPSASVSPTKTAAHLRPAAAPRLPPSAAAVVPAPTPRSIRAQKRQRLSGGGDGDSLPTPMVWTPTPTPAAASKSAIPSGSAVAVAPNMPLAPTASTPGLPSTSTPSLPSTSTPISIPIPTDALIPPPNATKTRSAKRKSLGAIETGASSFPLLTTDDDDKDLCLPLLKKKRIDANTSLSPSDNTMLTVKKSAASLKGKERAREVEPEIDPEPGLGSAPALPRVVSLRPRRRNAQEALTASHIPAVAAPKAPGKRKSTTPVAKSTVKRGKSKAGEGSPAGPRPSASDKQAPGTTRRRRAATASLSVSPSTTPPATNFISTPLSNSQSSTSSTSTTSSSASSTSTPATGSTTPTPTPTTTPTSPPPSPLRATLPSLPAHPHAITQPHIHSPLTPLAHTTTPPGSPPALHARVSPPLDAVDLGPLVALALPPAAVDVEEWDREREKEKEKKEDKERSRSASCSAHGSPAASPPPKSPGLLLAPSADAPSPPISPSTAQAFLGPFIDGPAPEAAPVSVSATPFVEPYAQASSHDQVGMGPQQLTLEQPLAQPVPVQGMLSMELALGIPLPLPMNMPVGGAPAESALGLGLGMGVGPGMGMLSESELGFGFQPQEGFGAPYAGQAQVYAPEGGQLDMQQQQQQQQIYAPEAGIEMGHEQQGQQQQQQQRGGSPQPSLRLTLKQQKKLTYMPPTRLEDPPLIQKDTGLWATACKLRVWELSKRYAPSVMRTVVAQEARDYFIAKGMLPPGYTSAQLRHQRRRSTLSAGGKSKRRARTLECDGEDGADDDDFMSEKTYDFELADDDDGVEDDWEGELYDGYGEYDDDEDEWDDEDETDDEEDEGEEGEDKAVSAVPVSTAAVIVVGSGEEGAALSGDEDAEGEMEVDIEAFSDPSFNAELSSPTSPTTPAAPLAPLDGRQSKFYVPPAGAFQMQYGTPPPTWDTEPPVEPPALQPAGAFGGEGQGNYEQQHQPLEHQPHDALHHSDNEPQQQHQHQHQPPIEIQLTPAAQYYLPPPPVDLPPPRLDSIRVAYLRQAELGAKLTGRGTPANRRRALEWARGYCEGANPGKRPAEADDGAEGGERGRPRLRLVLHDEGEAQGQEQRQQGDQSVLRLAAPEPVKDVVQWDAFLACLDDKPGAEGAVAAGLDLEQHRPHHHDIVSAAEPPSAYTTPRVGAGAPAMAMAVSDPSSSSSAALLVPPTSSPLLPAPQPAPSDAPPPTGDALFGLGMFDMGLGFASLLGSANAWFAPAGVNGPVEVADGTGVAGVGEQQDPHGTMPGGTSTLSFALG